MSCKLLERKQVLPQYRELFVALFKIEDPEVVQRVLEAINGEKAVGNNNCKCVMKTESNQTKYTQTYREDFEMTQNQLTNPPGSPKKQEEKRKRKRKLRGPRAEKSSIQVKKVLIQNDRLAKERHLELREELPLSGEENKPTNINHNNLVKNMTGDLVQYVQNIIDLDDCYIEDLLIPMKTQENLMSTMKDEYKDCLTYLDERGLLPIHEAIQSNNLNKVKRQLYIFKFLGVDLNEVLMKNDERNLLQFAILNCCNKNIFEELCKSGSSLIHEKDEDENNLINLAIDSLNETSDNELFKILLNLFFHNKNTLKYLEETNSQGQTVFHICVNRDKPIFCHLLFEQIDITLNVKFQNFENGNSKEELLMHYTNKISENLPEYLPEVRLKKKKIINNRDLKHGLTPLNQAVQNKNVLFVKIFLYHLADTNVKNYSGFSSLDQCENDSKLYSILNDFNKLNG